MVCTSPPLPTPEPLNFRGWPSASARYVMHVSIVHRHDRISSEHAGTELKLKLHTFP